MRRTGPKASARVLVVMILTAVRIMTPESAQRRDARRAGDADRKVQFTDPDGNTVSFIEMNGP